MKRLLSSLAVILLFSVAAGVAEIPMALRGVWSSGEILACSAAHDTDYFIIVTYQKYESHEFVCDVREVKQTSLSSWKLSFSCSGEGLEWETTENWSFKGSSSKSTLSIGGHIFRPCTF